MIKQSNNGQFTIPTAPSGGTVVAQSGTPSTFGSYVQLTASTGEADFITGIHVGAQLGTGQATWMAVQIGTGGSGSETTVGIVQVPINGANGAATSNVAAFVPINPPIPVAASTRIACKTASNLSTTQNWNVSLTVCKQADCVDAGINESSNVTQINAVSTSSVTTVNANQGTTQALTFDTNNLLKVDVEDFGGAAGTFTSGKPSVKLASTDVTGNVAADLQTIKTQTVTCAAGVTILANVGFAGTPGAASGGLIAGTNAATTISGLTLTGAAASGGTPATSGLTITGGAASTTSGGTAAPAISATGGAGAASTNGAAVGVSMSGGGTNTVASAAHGLSLTGTSTGVGISANGVTTGALSCTTITASGAVAFQSTFAVTSTTTLTGAVSLGSTLTVTGTTSLAAVTTSGTVTFNAFTISNAFTVSGGVTFTGAAASGGTPATSGLTITGGAASTSSGGVAADALVVTGGAGAASTNGAARGATISGGGTNTVVSTAYGLMITGTSVGAGAVLTGGNASGGNAAGAAMVLNGGNANTSSGGTAESGLIVNGGGGAASTNGAASAARLVGGGSNTVASTASGITFTGASLGHGIDCQSGSGSTGNGINAKSNATNGSGIVGQGTGTGNGFNSATGGANFGAMSCTTITASGAVALQSTVAVTGTTTLTGSVSLGNTLTITGTTSLAAVTTSGTVTFNAFTVSGATTLTGTVTATNAGNDIRGVKVSSGTVTTVTGDVQGKVLGGGASAITGVGAWALDGTGAAIAPAATALSDAVWTNLRAANLDNLDIPVSDVATDVWAISVPGAYPVGTAGYILGTFLDAAVSTLPAAAASDVFATVMTDGGYTFMQWLEVVGATTSGKSSGGPTTPVYKGMGTNTTRVTATCDSDGNRTSIIISA